MELIPAIDLRGGRCVNLYQGDYARETIYSDNPVEVASQWVGLGASRLHVVDLDGAKSGSPANLEAVRRIVSSVSVPIQFGGAIRTLDAARTAMSMGVDRVMVGTAAVETPDLIRDMCVELGSDAVVVSLDARDGYVAVKGWTASSRLLVSDLVRQMAPVGVRRFMYTDIARTGTLTEPNFHAVESLAPLAGSRLLVAGGISSLEHLRRLAGLGVEAAVVGKALYTGDIDLAEALEAVASTR